MNTIGIYFAYGCFILMLVSLANEQAVETLTSGILSVVLLYWFKYRPKEKKHEQMRRKVYDNSRL